MRGIARLYVLGSCFLFGVLLCSALVTGVALWLVPDWAEGVARALTDRIGRFYPSPAKEKPSGHLPDLARGPPASASSVLASPLGREAAGATPILDRRSGEAEKEVWIDVAALESRLQLLEGTVPSWKGVVGDEDSKAGPAEWKERLDAWEQVREPLFKFLSATAPSGVKVPFHWSSDIRTVAPQVVDRLKLLVEEKTSLRRRIVQKLEPRTLVRVLLENQSLSDAQAMEFLSQLSQKDASEVLERLSRVSPETTARLLRLVLADASDREREERARRAGNSSVKG